MKIIRSENIEFIPASHENGKNPGTLKRVLLQKKDFINGKIQMINWALLGYGKSFANHFHEDMQEIFIILKGKVEINVGEESAVLEKGDVVVIPPLKNHKMINFGKIDVEYIVVGVSSGNNGKTVILPGVPIVDSI
jgi:mannose-6-phosphate isomerase-like protein (cupin superfamily)